MGECKFGKEWIGKCGQPTVEGSDYCEEHSKEKCASCGAQATHECDETGQFVCGAPLCDECTHTTVDLGHNGNIGFFQLGELPEGFKSHCKKSEQVFKPWYMRKKFTHQVVTCVYGESTPVDDEHPDGVECMKTDAVFAGTPEECRDFVIQHADEVMKIVTITEDVLKFYESHDKLHTPESRKQLYGI